jgi:hypothetical protein
VLHVLAILLALIAVGCMVVAIAGMVSGRLSDRSGWLVRAVAVLSFAGAVLCNVLGH